MTASEAPADVESRGAATGRVLKLFTDGASRGNPGLSGAGALITTKEGEIVATERLFLGRATNNEAEYRAVILGLEAVLGHDPRHVEIYLDSELVVRQLNGDYRVKNSRLARLHREARGLIDRLRGCTIRHIERALNAEADRLANEAIDQRDR